MATVEAHHSSGGHDGYRHEAFFYDGADQFMAGIVPFIRGAVAAEEPILVVLGAPKIDALREALNGDTESVLFADMGEVGTNPARIIPAWQQFLSDHGAGGRRVRGIGEPIWAGRSSAELAECERHEALLNVAFADPTFWLRCPYDTGTLPPEVIDEAARNHPFVSDGTTLDASPGFPGTERLAEPFDKALPAPPADAVSLVVGEETLSDIRPFIARFAAEAGMVGERMTDLVLAVNEIATNSVRHGGGGGTLLVWSEPDTVLCEVRDRGRIADPLVGRVQPPPSSDGGRGLWMANQACELVQIRSFADGAAVRLHKRVR
jgi:anti-sigma regulatory factor (Ser/Thr protein kinase)